MQFFFLKACIDPGRKIEIYIYHLRYLAEKNIFNFYFLVLEAEVAEIAVSGKWVRVTLKIHRVYKRGNSTLRRGLYDVRVRERHLRCLCLNLKKNRKYLLLGKFGNSDPEPQLVIDKFSVALRWRNKFRRKLYALVQRTKSISGC